MPTNFSQNLHLFLVVSTKISVFTLVSTNLNEYCHTSPCTTASQEARASYFSISPTLAFYSHFQTYTLQMVLHHNRYYQFSLQMCSLLRLYQTCTCSLHQHNETLTIFLSKSKPFQLLTRLPSRITIVLFCPPLIYSFIAINLSKHIRAWLDRESFVTFFGLPYEIFGLVNCKRSTIIAKKHLTTPHPMKIDCRKYCHFSNILNIKLQPVPPLRFQMILIQHENVSNHPIWRKERLRNARRLEIKVAEDTKRCVRPRDYHPPKLQVPQFGHKTQTMRY